jgi:hypothetical protein
MGMQHPAVFVLPVLAQSRKPSIASIPCPKGLPPCNSEKKGEAILDSVTVFRIIDGKRNERECWGHDNSNNTNARQHPLGLHPLLLPPKVQM